MTPNSKPDSNTSSNQPPEPSRVDRIHGGQLLEAVAVGDLKSFNDADCKHERLIRDESETDFNAFMCANPNCNEVMLYDKE